MLKAEHTRVILGPRNEKTGMVQHNVAAQERMLLNKLHGLQLWLAPSLPT